MAIAKNIVFIYVFIHNVIQSSPMIRLLTNFQSLFKYLVFVEMAYFLVNLMNIYLCYTTFNLLFFITYNFFYLCISFQPVYQPQSRKRYYITTGSKPGVHYHAEVILCAFDALLLGICNVDTFRLLRLDRDFTRNSLNFNYYRHYTHFMKSLVMYLIDNNLNCYPHCKSLVCYLTIYTNNMNVSYFSHCKFLISNLFKNPIDMNLNYYTHRDFLISYLIIYTINRHLSYYKQLIKYFKPYYKLYRHINSIITIQILKIIPKNAFLVLRMHFIYWLIKSFLRVGFLNKRKIK